MAASIASIFSLRLTEQDVEGAQVLVAATFTVIAGTVAVQRTGARPLARRLGLIDDSSFRTVILGSNRMARLLAHTFAELGNQVTLVGMDRRNLSNARMEGLTALHGSVMEDDTWDQAQVSSAALFLAMSSQERSTPWPPAERHSSSRGATCSSSCRSGRDTDATRPFP